MTTIYDMVDSLSTESIEEQLNNLILPAFNSEGYVRTSSQMRGSELAHECMRINTLRLRNHDVSASEGFLTLAAESGKAIEALIRKHVLLNNSDKVALWDEWLPKSNKLGLNYSGKLDFMFDLPGYGLTVVDIKTTTRIGTEKRIDISDIESAYNDTNDITELLTILKDSKTSVRKSSTKVNDWLYQIISYATLCDVDHGAVFVISRNKESFYEPLTTMQLYHNVTDEEKYDTITKMLIAQRLNDQTALPAKPKKFKKTTTCKYCDFNDICWSKNNNNFLELTDKETQKLYDELYEEAVTLYDNYRKTLQFIRNKKIEEAAIIKNAILHPTEENIINLIKSKKVNYLDLLLLLEDNWKKDELFNINIGVQI